MEEPGIGTLANSAAPAPRAFGMFSFSIGKKKDQTTIDLEYANAVGALQTLLNEQQNAQDIALIFKDEDFSEEFRSLIHDAGTLKDLRNFIHVQRNFQRDHAQEFLGTITTILKTLPDKKEVATNAIVALTNVLKEPSPKNIKELFKAKRALVNADIAFHAAAISIAGIGASAAITSVVLLLALSSTPPGLALGLGILLAAGVILAAAGCFMLVRRHDVDDSSIQKENIATDNLHSVADVMDKCGDALQSGLRQVGLCR